MRPSALVMSDPFMDQGEQVDQCDQSGSTITNEQGVSWDRKSGPGTENMFPGTVNIFPKI